MKLRPVTPDDLDLLRRFVAEPGLIGLDWNGHRDPRRVGQQYEEDGFLGTEHGRLMVDTDGATAGFVSWGAGSYDGGRSRYWEIGIALLPEYRGQGIGWRAQSMLADYLFEHTTAERIQAGTHPENLAEQKALVKAGFQFEGVLRACEFRAGRYRDGYLYSRLRSDLSPTASVPGPGC
ncbi:hypothetical protein GCM10029976_030960 [Kribbella albertanoniae]|uniref:N-acetyltransferase n=1 Tax=Kribbella albertanoniae TaxID=1266829 RepID=A0A4V2XMJ7_9ACTN|nr:GNAT family protein [Kribbella albertanoniae]TDC14526.1 N-acetyltransferase [Kribbella albertanoniae]